MRGLSILAVLLAVRPAVAEDAEIPPPPDGFDFKRPLSPEDYERKNENWYPTGLPLANFDSNTGIGGGVRGYLYFNGDRDDPLFAYTPYLHRLFLQAFFTTKGLQFHWFDYDAPAIAGTPYRLRAQAIYMRNTSQHFFGVGEDALGELTFTGAGRTYAKWADYDADLRTVQDDGTALSRYDHFDIERPIGLISLERTYFRGVVRPLVGVGVNWTKIRDYTGEDVDAVTADGMDTTAPMGPTRLSEQCATDAVVGCDGGWENYLRLGVSYDTRDFEPDPNNGIFADIALDIGTVALGSDYDFVRFLVAGRYYRSLLPGITDLVLATRGTFEVQSEGSPFYALNTVPYTDDPRNGLGGLRTLRGFQQDRFLGHVYTLLNTELRWTFVRYGHWKQKFSWTLVAFMDTGRAYDELSNLTLKNWRRGQGGAVRIAWNLATVVVVEYGFSDEDAGLYINFNHQF